VYTISLMENFNGFIDKHSAVACKYSQLLSY